MTKPLTVILAGGEGRRIGGAKPLRMLGGERLIDRAVRTARLWSDDLRLALREQGQVLSVDLPVLVDDPDIQGPLAGLRSALHGGQEAQRRFVLTIPCDVPFLPRDLAPRLMSGIDDRLAALAASGLNVHPTCALWRVEALDQLPAFLESGRRSLVGFAEAVGFARVEWGEENFFNVNSGADLAEAEARLRSEVQHIDKLASFNSGVSGP